MSVERLLWQSFALSPTFLAHSWLDSGYEARIRTRNTNTTGLPSTLLLLQYLPCSWLLLSTPPPCPRKWQLDPHLTVAVSNRLDSLETWILTMMVSLTTLMTMTIMTVSLMKMMRMMTMTASPTLLIQMMTMTASLIPKTMMTTMMVYLMPLIPMMITMAFLMILTMMMMALLMTLMTTMTMMASLTTWTFLVMKGNGDSDLDLDLLFSAWSFWFCPWSC